jgi:nucleotide sugar dehydrogenase
VVCVQGLGFVGAAMTAALAAARTAEGAPCFNVVGVDLGTARGRHAIEHLAGGRFPFATADSSLETAIAEACATGNLAATCDSAAYGLAEIIVVDVNLDLTVDADGAEGASLDLSDFRAAIRTLGRCMRPDALVVVETTVPPGTCAHVVAPELEAALRARGLAHDRYLLAHSYERVMPGADYLESIVNYWRVYAGHTPGAAEACAAFLSRFVNVTDFPLCRLSSTTASEAAKVLENSYRAVNIAFMEEWGRFGEAAGLDVFEIVDAIRERPTHSNMRQPGFGVGGYCLPKDPLMALVAARQILDLESLDFPFCRMAVATNRAMPRVSLNRLQDLVGGSLSGLRIALLGVSYRPEVADTRHAPAEPFVREARARGAEVALHDPLVTFWPELGCEVAQELPDPHDLDAIVFATAHGEYRRIAPAGWLNGARPAIFDANDVLTEGQRRDFRAAGCRVACIGRGGET